MNTESPEKSKFLSAIYYPVLLIILIWIVKIFEWIGGISLGHLGVLPREINGLYGILFSPLLHADFYHLMNNSVPLLVLSCSLSYFYRPIAFKVFSLIWITTGLCVWIGGREAYHIGASGVIYGLASFLFFSGIFGKNPKLLAISLLVIFLYGSMVWGIFPFFPDISFESHLFGFLSGLTFAYIYSRDNKKDESPENTDDPDDSFPYWEVENSEDLKIN
jgi:membrane associated rhomboid family serine protease